MTKSQRCALLAEDQLKVDRMLGHADLARLYPTPVTITRGLGPKASNPLRVSRGFVLAPVKE